MENGQYVTYVTSKTWDPVRNCSYPDKREKIRDMAEIDRLLSQGHKLTIVIDMTPIEFNLWMFENILMGLHPEYKRDPKNNEDIRKEVKNTNTATENKKNNVPSPNSN